MGKLTEEVFNESCCDGGSCSTDGKSTLPCGCDPGINYTSPNCWLHRGTSNKTELNLANDSIPEVYGRSVPGQFDPVNQMVSMELVYEKEEFLKNLKKEFEEIDIKRKEVETKMAEHKNMRVFETGATRDQDTSKLDFEGFESPLVLERFAEFMHSNRKQKDGNLRDSDNWQKGIPKDAYMKSMWRHLMDVWLHHRGYGHKAKEPLEVALCALRFNVSGYLFEELKERMNQKEKGI